MAASSFQTLIPLALLVVILAMSNSAQSQSTSFTYDFYGDRPSDLKLQGDAHFPSDTTYLRLTKTDNAGTPQPNSIGRVVYSEPIQFSQSGAQADFETTVKFIVKPTANSNKPADGIVFFMGPVGTSIPNGATGGNLGIYNPNGNSSKLFAVEFDIYVNTFDPNFKHVGINVETSTSRSVVQIPDSMLGQEVTLRVNYVGAKELITARATAGSLSAEVTLNYDLSDFLPQQVQVGLAAATGDYVAIHDVVAWYFTSTMVNQITAHHGQKESAYIRQFV